MAVILKSKKKVEATKEEQLSELAALIDKVGALQAEAEDIDRQIKELELQKKPYKEALAELEGKIAEIEADDDAKWTEKGQFYECEISAKGTSREVTNIEKVYEFLGPELFTQLVTIKLKDIDAYLNPIQKEEVLTTTRTKRRVKIVKRP